MNSRLPSPGRRSFWRNTVARSEEHTSELQSHHDLVCRLLLEKKKFRDGVQRDWYIALAVLLVVLPLLLPDFMVDFSMLFIYGLCGLSLMVLAGFTGLVILRHA